MNLRKLDEREIEAALKSVAGLSLKLGKFFQEFTFPGFIEAFSFVASVATAAERDWCRCTVSKVFVVVVSVCRCSTAPALRMPPQTFEPIIRSRLQTSGLTEGLLTGPSRARYHMQTRADIARGALVHGIANFARRLHRSESAISQAVSAGRNALRQITSET